MKFLFKIILLFLLHQISIAQNSKTLDSLQKALKESKTDLEKVTTLYQLTKVTCYDDPKKAEKYALKGIKLSQKIKNQKEEGRLLSGLGLVYYVMFDLEKSQKTFFKALKIQVKIRDRKGEATTLNNIGLTYYVSGDYANAIKYYLESLKIEEELGNEKGFAQSYGNVALVWIDLGNYEKAEEFLLKSLKYAKKYEQKQTTSAILQNLALNYFKKQELDSALSYANRALKYAKDLEFKYGIAKARSMRTQIFTAKADYKKALKEILLAKNIYQTIENQHELAQSKFFEAVIRVKIGETDLAKSLFNEASTVLEELEDLEFLRDTYKYLTEIYKKENNWEKALENQDLYVLYQDSILNEKNTKQIISLQIEHETERKEQEIINLSKENQIKSLNLVILGIALVLLTLLGLVLYLIYRQKRISLMQKNQEIEQKLLRLQMNPHFIFNVMTAIQEYMFNKDSQKAGVYLSKFSKLMRQVLENSRNEYISIEQEVDMLENYLTLQNLIQEDKFEYDIQVAEELLEEEVAIPPMFAQPFVENAIIHGISELTGKGKIEINFSKKEKGIELEIMDNGVGIKKSLTIDKKEYNSLATQITKERIKLFRDSFKQDIDFNIQSLKQGTSVLFSLPYKYL